MGVTIRKAGGRLYGFAKFMIRLAFNVRHLWWRIITVVRKGEKPRKYGIYTDGMTLWYEFENAFPTYLNVWNISRTTPFSTSITWVGALNNSTGCSLNNAKNKYLSCGKTKHDVKQAKVCVKITRYGKHFHSAEAFQTKTPPSLHPTIVPHPTMRKGKWSDRLVRT